MVKFQKLALSLKIFVGMAYSNNAIEISDERRAPPSEFHTPHINFQLHDQQIKLVNPINPTELHNTEGMVKHLKDTKQFMPPQTYSNNQPIQSVLTGRYMDVKFNKGFYAEIRDIVDLSLSLWEVKGDAIFVTPSFKAKDFALTVTGVIKILAPENSDPWLKGVVINSSNSSEQPVQCILSGDIDFESTSPIDNFLVIGTSVVKFLV